MQMKIRMKHLEKDRWGIKSYAGREILFQCHSLTTDLTWPVKFSWVSRVKFHRLSGSATQ
jgi:hypothetical protein